MHQKRWIALFAVILTFGLVAAACGDDNKSSSGSDKTTTTKADTSGTLVGMRGTTPLGAQSKEFQDRLLKIDPELLDFNYASEAYDAVTITALAAEVAKTDGIDLAKQINGVTKDGTEC